MNKQPPSASSTCHSVFHGGAATTTAEKYTQLWTTLINQMEHSKKTLAEAK